MAKPDPTSCDVKLDGVWVPVSLIAAQRRYALALKRCPARHGPAMVSASYTASVKRSLTHRRTHDGCPLIPRLHCGTASPHPNAVA